MNKKTLQTYTISSARIEKDDGQELVISPTGPRGGNSFLAGGFFAIIGGVCLYVGLGGSFLTIAGLIFLGTGISITFFSPFLTRVVFDFRSREIIYEAKYIVHRPRIVQHRSPLARVDHFEYSKTNGMSRKNISIHMQDGASYLFMFGNRSFDAENVNTRLTLLEKGEATLAGLPVEHREEVMNTINLEKMNKEARSWAYWLIIMGAIQMVAAKGFSQWGLLLIIIGLISFYYKESPMFLVYAATIGWAGISNLISAESLLWKGFSLLQFYWAYTLFRDFRRYQEAEQSFAASGTAVEEKSVSFKILPWVAPVLGVGGLLGYGFSFLIIFINAAFFRSDFFYQISDILMTISLYAGLLGFATGLAGWLSAGRKKVPAIIGCLAGGLTMVVIILVTLLLQSGLLDSPEPTLTGWMYLHSMIF
ncbi:MAG: hypothetical protein AB9891_05975 [Anaerolineaceae bacterium]